jgi:hypothetical protein
VQFISLSDIDLTLATMPKARVSKAVKGVPTLADLPKLTDRERRNLANMVSKSAVTTPTPEVEPQPKPTPVFFRHGKTPR